MTNNIFLKFLKLCDFSPNFQYVLNSFEFFLTGKCLPIFRDFQGFLLLVRFL